MRLIKFILSRIIVSAILLYSFNFIAINFNICIPINVYTLAFTSFFGTFGLFGLVLFKFVL